MKRKQIISFFGSSLVSAYWNGAATYYRGIIKSLHDLGYHVNFYEPVAYDRQKHRDIPNPDYARVITYSGDREGLNSALEDATGSDIVIKNSGVGLYDDLLEKEVLKFKKDGAKVIFWDVDAPATLDRIENHPNDKFRKLIPEYDLILTYGGGDPVVKAYEEFNAKKCIPVYNALDPGTHFPVEAKDEYKCDLSFLGNRMPDREDRVHEFFFKAAKMLPDKKFILGGNGWIENSPGYDNVRLLGHVYTKDHNAFNSSPKAVLNISRDSMVRYGFSPATRIFEAAGSAACIITDKWKGIELFLEPGKEVLVADSGDEVVEIMNSLTDDKAKEIGDAALKRVLGEHTYDHRAIELNKIFKQILSHDEAKIYERTS